MKVHVRGKKKEWSKNLSKPQFPKMLHMSLTAQPQFLMIAQQPSFLHHTKLSFIANNLDEPAFSHRTIWYDFPLLFLIRANNMILLKIQILLSERMVNVVTLLIFMMGFASLLIGFWLRLVAISSDKSPTVILDNMVCIRGAAGYFVEFGEVGVGYFVCMHEVFGFEIAECEGIVQVKELGVGIYFW